ncbi:MAG: alkaline phosphatase family protein [Micrococcus sp.]|nr:alkaline phosphatase family protein [Micrococcus sp.]
MNADAPAPPSSPTAPESSLRSVLPSAAAALGVAGMPNALRWPATRRAVVVMVDGLGRALLRRFGGHAPFLKSAMAEHGRVLQAAIPTTTAASLTSFGTGEDPGVHGIVGYDVLDPERGVVINQLGGWDERTDPLTWQPLPTVLERAEQAGVDVVTVSLPAFEHSALTRAALRGGRFLAGRSMTARAQLAAQEVGAARVPLLVYLYFNELDKAGHRSGVGSEAWLYALEELDATLRRLHQRLPAGSTLAITGDHGMMDIPASRRIDVTARDGNGALRWPHLMEHVAHLAGEPRCVQVHLDPAATPAQRDAVLAAWQQVWGSQAWILTREEATAAGWFGETVTDRVAPRIGDLLVAPHTDLALYDGARVDPQAFEMVGQHGSPTRAEREVPLILLST